GGCHVEIGGAGGWSEESSPGSRSRMIENITRIHTNRHAPLLADLNSFLDRHIGGPGAQILKPVLTESTSLTGQRSLENNVAAGIRHRIEGAEVRQKRRQIVSVIALRVLNLLIQGVAAGIGEE